MVPMKSVDGLVPIFPPVFHALADDHAGSVTEFPLGPDIDSVFPASDSVCAGVFIVIVFDCSDTVVIPAPMILLKVRFAHIFTLNTLAHAPRFDAVFISPALQTGNGAFCTSLLGHCTNANVGVPLCVGIVFIMTFPLT